MCTKLLLIYNKNGTASMYSNDPHHVFSSFFFQSAISVSVCMSEKCRVFSDLSSFGQRNKGKIGFCRFEQNRFLCYFTLTISNDMSALQCTNFIFTSIWWEFTNTFFLRIYVKSCFDVHPSYRSSNTHDIRSSAWVKHFTLLLWGSIATVLFYGSR